MPVVDVDVATLGGADPNQPGIHGRLLAAMQSLATRGKVPEIKIGPKRRGSSSPDPNFDDFDFYYDIEVDDTDPSAISTNPTRLGDRIVVGTVSWPVHVTHTGGTEVMGHYDPVRFDLTVHSKSRPGEVTHFIGELPLHGWQPGTVGAEVVRLGEQYATRVMIQTQIWGDIDGGAVQ